MAPNVDDSLPSNTKLGLDNAAKAIVSELQHLRKAVVTTFNGPNMRCKLNSFGEYESDKGTTNKGRKCAIKVGCISCCIYGHLYQCLFSQG